MVATIKESHFTQRDCNFSSTFTILCIVQFFSLGISSTGTLYSSNSSLNEPRPHHR